MAVKLSMLLIRLDFRLWKRGTNLKSEENLCEGLHPDQIRGYDHGRWVVGAVVVRRGFTWWDRRWSSYKGRDLETRTLLLESKYVSPHLIIKLQKYNSHPYSVHVFKITCVLFWQFFFDRIHTDDPLIIYLCPLLADDQSYHWDPPSPWISSCTA